MNKLYLCGMTSAGNEKNLREMIEPILEYFDGLVWTFHEPIQFFSDGSDGSNGPCEYGMDLGWEYLEQNKKEGKIILGKWVQRHHHSMNRFLYEGPMQDGDFFVILDSSERLSPDFCKNLRDVCKSMDEQNVGVMSNFGKPLIVRYAETLEFKGSPHWFLTGVVGIQANTELDKKEFWNVRDEQREPYHWIFHYGKYMLYPAGSNHALLGLEKNGDPIKLFSNRELLRLEFRQELKKRGFPLTIEGVEKCFREQLDDIIKKYINEELVWNNFYRHVILGETDMVDDHDFQKIKKIE